MNVEQKTQGEDTLNLPKTKEKLETKINAMLKQLGENKNIEDLYNELYGKHDKYTGDIKQVKHLFSYAFIKLRDSKEVESNKDNNSSLEINLRNGGNLSVRDENGKRFSIVGDKTIVTSLGEIKKMRGLDYIKIRFINSLGKTVEGFVSERRTKAINKDLRYLNGYLKQLGIDNNNDLVKENIYHEIRPFGKYKGTPEQNGAIYHYLVQKYEIDPYLVKQETQQSGQELKEKIDKKTEKKVDPQKTEQPQKPKKEKQQESKKEKQAKNIEAKPNAIYQEILKDKLMSEYIEKHFNGDFDKFLLRTFGISGGLDKIQNVTDMARTYGYLFIKTRKLGLYVYTKELGIDFKDRYNHIDTDDRKVKGKDNINILKSKYSYNENESILYLLISKYELGDDVLKAIRKENNINIMALHGLNPDKIKSRYAGTKKCSRTARYNLEAFKISRGNIDAHHARVLIKGLKTSGFPEVKNNDLEPKLKALSKNKNVFDIYPETKNGHRAIVFLGKDSKLYVLDPYYGTRDRNPQLLKSRIKSMDGVCSNIVIGRQYKISSSN